MEPVFLDRASGSERGSYDTRLPLDLLNDAHVLLHLDVNQRAGFGMRQRAGALDAGAVKLWIIWIEKNQHSFVRNVVQDLGLVEYVSMKLLGQFKNLIADPLQCYFFHRRNLSM